MEQVSGWFRSEPTSEVEHVCYVDVFQSGAPVANAEGGPLRIYPTGGSIIFDRAADTRRALTMECAMFDEFGTDLVPNQDDPTSKLAKGITELRVYMGYRWPRANPETGSRLEVVPMGFYRIKASGAGEDDAGVPTVKVSAMDGSWLMRQSPSTAFQIAAATPNGDAFAAILRHRDPTIATFITDTEYTLGTAQVVSLTDSPWEKAQNVAGAAGCVGYFDRRNRAVMAPSIVTAGDPVFSFVEGDGATFAETEVAGDIEDSPNVITIIGTSGGGSGTVRATAADRTPGSPTNVDAIGEFTEVVRSPLYNTNTQAHAAAVAMLTRKLAANDRITFTAGRQPALSEEDTIAITRAQLHLVRRRTVIERIEFPLAEPTMSVACQRTPDDIRNVA